MHSSHTKFWVWTAVENWPASVSPLWCPLGRKKLRKVSALWLLWNSKELLTSALLDLLRNYLLFSSLKVRMSYYLQNWLPSISVHLPAWTVQPCPLEWGSSSVVLWGPFQGIKGSILISSYTGALNHPCPYIPSKSFIKYKGAVRGNGDMSFLHGITDNPQPSASYICHVRGNFNTCTIK